MTKLETNFDINYNEQALNRNIEFLSRYQIYKDYYVHCNLYENGNKISTVTASFTQEDFESNDMLDLSADEFETSLKCLIYDEFDKLSSLPKLSDCSNLLQYVYDAVSLYDSKAIHIDINEWNEMLQSDMFSFEDFDRFEEDIKKFNIGKDVIQLYPSSELDTHDVIVAYGSLEEMFNDDRDIAFNKTDELDM